MKLSDSTGYGMLIPGSSHLVYMRLTRVRLYTFQNALLYQPFLQNHKFLPILVQLFMLIKLYEDQIFITFPVIFDIPWIKIPSNSEMTFPLISPIYSASNCFLYDHAKVLNPNPLYLSQTLSHRVEITTVDIWPDILNIHLPQIFQYLLCRSFKHQTSWGPRRDYQLVFKCRFLNFFFMHKL